MQDRAGIYCLINRINGKKYIGSSKHLKDRLLEHLTQLESHTHSNKELQEAFDNCGLDMCIVEYVDSNESLLECEQKWINFYDSTNPNYGYNKINSSSYSKQHVSRKRYNNVPKAIRLMDELTRDNKMLRMVWRMVRVFLV